MRGRSLTLFAALALAFSGTALAAGIKGTKSNDRIDVIGGGANTVSCGKGVDVVTADPEDRIARDCEIVSRRISIDTIVATDGQHQTEVEPDAAARAGADAYLIVAGDLADDDGDRLRDAAARVVELGLDWVVSVGDEDELARVLELHDPEIFHLAGADLQHALELLTDVPAGKLAIAEATTVTRPQVLELERAGIDAVIVPAGDVAELVGGAPPAV